MSAAGRAVSTRWLPGISALTDYYDGYVIDQFGVLHDGVTAYPGAADTLRELRARHKRVIVLSNSGKRAAHNAERLARFGVTPDHYDALITSGELTHQMLRLRDREPFARLGRRVWLAHPAEDQAMIDGLGLTVVAHPAQADFLLLASLADDQPLAPLAATLQDAVGRGLPLICANPDRQRLTTRGVEDASGTLAQAYADAGGAVVWVGKPHPLIYTACREALGRWGSRDFLAIGDSLEHDIGGGARAGYDTCFVAGGLHGQAFAAAPDDVQRDALLDRLLASPDAHAAPAPTWAVSTLRWTGDPAP